jgi:S1-C subfamily serine protease
VRGDTSVGVRVHDGSFLSARSWGGDPRTDLAVLRVEREDLRPLPWGDSTSLRAGSFAIALGNPLALHHTASLGVISSTYRRFNHLGKHWIEGALQVDVAVAPGSSGSALLDADGALIGLIIANNTRYPGLAFAIPSTTAQWVVEELVTVGWVERAKLGMRVRAVPAPPAAGTGLLVALAQVARGSRAEAAGLRIGDVLVDANGQRLAGVHLAQRHLTSRSASGPLSIRFLRGDRWMTTQVAAAGST